MCFFDSYAIFAVLIVKMLVYMFRFIKYENLFRNFAETLFWTIENKVQNGIFLFILTSLRFTYDGLTFVYARFFYCGHIN